MSHFFRANLMKISEIAYNGLEMIQFFWFCCRPNSLNFFFFRPILHDNNRSELNELNKLYSLCKKTLFFKKIFFSNKKQLFFEMIGLSRFDYFTDYRHETRKK